MCGPDLPRRSVPVPARPDTNWHPRPARGRPGRRQRGLARRGDAKARTSTRPQSPRPQPTRGEGPGCTVEAPFGRPLSGAAEGPPGSPDVRCTAVKSDPPDATPARPRTGLARGGRGCHAREGAAHAGADSPRPRLKEQWCIAKGRPREPMRGSCGAGCLPAIRRFACCPADPNDAPRGLGNPFAVCAPSHDQRQIHVGGRRTRIDRAHCGRHLADIDDPDAETIVPVVFGPTPTPQRTARGVPTGRGQADQRQPSNSPHARARRPAQHGRDRAECAPAALRGPANARPVAPRARGGRPRTAPSLTAALPEPPPGLGAAGHPRGPGQEITANAGARPGARRN